MGLIQQFIFLIIGFAVLAFGADVMISGAVKIAKRFNVSSYLIGLTIIAFGTSLPEIVISIISAFEGSPKIAIGNAIGSNIANIGLVIGLTAIFFPLRIRSEIVKKQFPMLFSVILLVAILLADTRMDRIDGLVLFWAGFIFILTYVQRAYRKKRKEALADQYKKEVKTLEIPVVDSLFRPILELIAGLIILPISSHVIVNSAVAIADYFHVNQLIIGLTMVAFGTSLPELATSVMGAKRKQYDIVIGNVMGSNIFNLLVVLAIPAIIQPINVHYTIIFRDFLAMFVFAFMLYVFSFVNLRKNIDKISRKEGVALTLYYILYILILVVF